MEFMKLLIVFITLLLSNQYCDSVINTISVDSVPYLSTLTNSEPLNTNWTTYNWGVASLNYTTGDSRYSSRLTTSNISWRYKLPTDQSIIITFWYVLVSPITLIGTPSVNIAFGMKYDDYIFSTHSVTYESKYYSTSVTINGDNFPIYKLTHSNFSSFIRVFSNTTNQTSFSFNEWKLNVKYQKDINVYSLSPTYQTVLYSSVVYINGSGFEDGIPYANFDNGNMVQCTYINSTTLRCPTPAMSTYKNVTVTVSYDFYWWQATVLNYAYMFVPVTTRSISTAAVSTGITTGVTTGITTGITTGVTTGVTTGETTGITTGDTTGITTGITTGVTTGVTTIDLSTGDTTGITTGETTGVTTGLTTGETTGITTGITTGETTGITSEDLSTGITTGETTGITTGETTGVTTGLTTGETTGITTGETTGITTGITSEDMSTGVTTGVTTGITTGETTGITSEDMSTGITTGLTTGETTGITTGETTGITTGVTTGITTGETTGITSEDMSTGITTGLTTGKTTGETTGITSEDMSTGITTGITTGVTSDNLSTGVTSDDLSTGATSVDLSTGVTTSDVSTGVTTGDVTTGITSHDISTSKVSTGITSSEIITTGITSSEIITTGITSESVTSSYLSTGITSQSVTSSQITTNLPISNQENITFSSSSFGMYEDSSLTKIKQDIKIYDTVYFAGKIDSEEAHLLSKNLNSLCVTIAGFCHPLQYNMMSTTVPNIDPVFSIDFSQIRAMIPPFTKSPAIFEVISDIEISYLSNNLRNLLTEKSQYQTKSIHTIRISINFQITVDINAQISTGQISTGQIYAITGATTLPSINVTVNVIPTGVTTHNCTFCNTNKYICSNETGWNNGSIFVDDPRVAYPNYKINSLKMNLIRMKWCTKNNATMKLVVEDSEIMSFNKDGSDECSCNIDVCEKQSIIDNNEFDWSRIQNGFTLLRFNTDSYVCLASFQLTFQLEQIQQPPSPYPADDNIEFNSQSESPRKSNTVMIVVPVIACVLVVTLAVFGIIIYRRGRRKGENKSTTSKIQEIDNPEPDNVEELVFGDIKPTIYQNIPDQSLSKLRSDRWISAKHNITNNIDNNNNNNSYNDNGVTNYNSISSNSNSTNSNSNNSNNNSTRSLFSSTSTLTEKYVVNADEIKVNKEIGKGAFGNVYAGNWRSVKVAVKLLRAESLKEEEINDFIREVNIMMCIKNHKNVVAFLGYCTDPLCLITEFMSNGSLEKLLHNTSYIIDKEMKMNLIKGIAIGMQHLQIENIVHKDLASRNILLDDEMSPKVSDFGLSRKLGSDEVIYSKTDLGPLRWMAPESLTQKKFSVKSDVWSFGITCLEIINQTSPYPDLDMLGFSTEVVNDTLNPIKYMPLDFDATLYNLLTNCFNKDPKGRPDFAGIVSTLESNQLQNIRTTHNLRGPTHSNFNQLEHEDIFNDTMLSRNNTGYVAQTMTLTTQNNGSNVNTMLRQSSVGSISPVNSPVLIRNGSTSGSNGSSPNTRRSLNSSGGGSFGNLSNVVTSPLNSLYSPSMGDLSIEEV